MLPSDVGRHEQRLPEQVRPCLADAPAVALNTT